MRSPAELTGRKRWHRCNMSHGTNCALNMLQLLPLLLLLPASALDVAADSAAPNYDDLSANLKLRGAFVQRRLLAPSGLPIKIKDCNGKLVSSAVANRIWNTAMNLGPSLVASESSWASVIRDNLMLTRRAITFPTKPATPNQLVSLKFYVYPESSISEAGLPIMVLDNLKPITPVASDLVANVIQVTPVTSFATTGTISVADPKGVTRIKGVVTFLDDFKTEKGINMIPARYTTKIPLGDNVPNSIVLTDRFTGCTMAWSYSAEKKTLFCTHIKPEQISGSQLYYALKDGGSVVFEENQQGLPAKMFGNGDPSTGGYGESDQDIGFFMVTKTQDKGVYITFQSVDATKQLYITKISWKVLEAVPRKQGPPERRLLDLAVKKDCGFL